MKYKQKAKLHTDKNKRTKHKTKKGKIRIIKNLVKAETKGTQKNFIYFIN